MDEMDGIWGEMDEGNDARMRIFALVICSYVFAFIVYFLQLLLSAKLSTLG